ncbi:MAG: formyltetrahydrofolate deformylase [Myxococcota bacterium]
MDPEPTATLLIHCPDRPGLVAAATTFLSRHRGNIVYLDQHVDAQKGVFFMRLEWELSHFDIAREDLDHAFRDEVGGPFEMDWTLHFSDERQRMAVFVSKQPHCLYDVFSRWRAGEWTVDIPLVLSNHPDLEPVARRFEVPYEVVPITRATRDEQEPILQHLLEQHGVDTILLARYMQILSPGFVDAWPQRIINIHHSFLPAFPGARPYHSAHERGVKIIGATSHYVTEDLDAGPIIEQDVTRVTHRDSVDELVRKGRDLERVVLARAVRKHLEHKILCYDNRTVIFD